MPRGRDGVIVPSLLDGVLNERGGIRFGLRAALHKIPDLVSHRHESHSASPAHAASTAALRARILVWIAISSIALMIRAILLPEASISFILSTVPSRVALTSPDPFAEASINRATRCA